MRGFAKKSVIICFVLLPPLLLFFQNCGKAGSSTTNSSSSASLQPVLPGPPQTPTTSVGGFNRIAPTITNSLTNQTLLSGLMGRHSGTRIVNDLVVTADAGAGESFQTLTLRCALTGNPDIQSDCNNRNFANGRVTFDISPRDGRECLSGTAQLRYWVEDSDPLNAGVPVLRSAERTISIQIQNTCYSEAKIYPTERSGQNNFGSTVKLTANFLFASAPGNDVDATNAGAIHVFTRSGAQWVQSQLVRFSQPAPELKVSTLAAAGNHLLVGSPFSDNEVGAVFAFRATNNLFSEIQVLKPNTPSALGFDHYGHAAATDGTWLAVGAPNDSTGGLVARGAIYLYQWVTNAWVFRTKLLGQSAYEQLGISLSMSANYLVAGAPENFNGQIGPGSVYVYTREGVFMTALTGGPGVAATSIFGASVAVQGSQLIVGAPVADGSADDSGAAYIYAFEGGAWVYKQKLQAPDGQRGDEFGASVDISGVHAVVGARRESADRYRKGAAYHFKFGTTWSHTFKMMATDRVERDYFGTSVSIHNTDVVIGAHLDDGLTGAFIDGLGAAYVYGLR